MLQYLVRHGQSVSNVEERVQGQEDVALSALGHLQAAEVAAWAARFHADSPFTEVWASPLARAHDTAAAIASRIDREVSIAEDLRELHAGVFQGHLWGDLEVLFPEAVARWRSGDTAYRIPGGESRADLAARGRAILEKLATRDVASMIVVAHGGILTAALGSLLGPTHPILAAAATRPFTKLPALENASLTVLEWPGPILHRFNDTAHLSGDRVGGPAPGDG
jgi:broad specificity phosphatase PhoE